MNRTMCTSMEIYSEASTLTCPSTPIIQTQFNEIHCIFGGHQIEQYGAFIENISLHLSKLGLVVWISEVLLYSCTCEIQLAPPTLWLCSMDPTLELDYSFLEVVKVYLGHTNHFILDSLEKRACNWKTLKCRSQLYIKNSLASSNSTACRP